MQKRYWKALLPSGEYLVAMLCYLGTLTISACMFWSSPLVTWLSSDESTLELSTNEVNVVVYIFEVSCIVIVFPAGYVASRFGRKAALACAYPTGVLSFALALSVVNFPSLLIARLLQGVVIGILSTVGPEYGAETTRNEIRGFTICMFYTVFAFGGLLTAVLGSQLSYTAYSWICLALPAVGTVGIFFLPESPHYLMMKGERFRAEESLKWLRNSEDVSKEIEEIEKVLEKDMTQSSGYRGLLTSSEHRRPLVVCTIVTLAATMIGFPAIPTYAFNLFPSATHMNFSSETLGISINVFTVIGAIAVTFLADAWGRRPLILLSATASCIFALMVIIYLLIDQYASPVSREFSYFLLMSVVAFAFFITFIQSLQVLLQAELFAASVRSEAAVVIQVINAASTLVQLVLYPVINEYCGTAVNFLLYLIYSTVFLGCMKFFMPETAGQFLGKTTTMNLNLFKKSAKKNQASCK